MVFKVNCRALSRTCYPWSPRCGWVVGHFTDARVFVKVSVVEADFGRYSDPLVDQSTREKKEEEFWATISSTKEIVQLA